MNSFESDLDRWVQKREELSHKADELKLQREDLLQASEVSVHYALLSICQFIHLIPLSIALATHSILSPSIYPFCLSIHPLFQRNMKC